jgi:hypothetical protein
MLRQRRTKHTCEIQLQQPDEAIKRREKWEKVRTTNITTSKTKKISENSVDDQNIEKIYLSDQNVESQKDQNVKNVF